MALLVIGGVEIPLAPGGLSESEPLEIGDRLETFNGTERSGISARKRRWQGVTRSMEVAEYDTVRAALTSVPPLSATVRGQVFTISVRLTGGPYPFGDEGVIQFELRER
jgi:hypothetical protein